MASRPTGSPAIHGVRPKRCENSTQPASAVVPSAQLQAQSPAFSGIGVNTALSAAICTPSSNSANVAVAVRLAPSQAGEAKFTLADVSVATSPSPQAMQRIS